MRIGSHEYANEADDDDDDVPKPAQSLGTPVPRQKCDQYTFELPLGGHKVKSLAGVL